ncbi:MAG: GAF domain-containing protein, partial [Candidatus Rokubacteria bacterium]|nr:GAF domain-containing protein [Candidatus Rokubacteria bacterium]
MLQRLVEGARELTGSDMARIALRDPASERFTLRHWVGSIHPAWRDLVLEPGRGLAGQALLTGRSVRTDSYAEDPRFPKDYLAVAREENTVAVMAVPIRGDERIEALLIVIRTVPRRYTDQDEAILSRLADHAAAAIQNARLYAESAARRQSAEALAEVGRVLAGSLDVRQVLDLIVDRSCALLGTERSAVALVATDPSAPDVRFVASRGLSADFHALRPVHSRDGTTALALAERRAVWSADLLNDPAFDLSPTTRARVEAEGYRAVLSLPLLVGDRVLGALMTYRDTPGPFSEPQVALLQAFADQAALALENARLYEESEGQRRGAEAVAEHGRALLETLDPRARGQQTADSARALLGAEVAAVYRLEPATGAVAAIAVAGQMGPAFGPAIVFPPGTGVVGVAVRERQPVATPDVLADARITLTPGLRTAIEQAGYRSVLSVPLFVEDRVIGALSVGDRLGREFADDEVRIMRTFAAQAALALENARLFEETERRRREIELTAELAHAIGATLDLDTVLQRITDGAKDLLGSDVASIGLREPDTGALRARYRVGARTPADPVGEIRPGQGLGGRILASGRPVRTDNYAEDPALSRDFAAQIAREGIVTGLGVPILIDGRVEGALVVWNRAARPFT